MILFVNKWADFFGFGNTQYRDYNIIWYVEIIILKKFLLNNLMPIT